MGRENVRLVGLSLELHSSRSPEALVGGRGRPAADMFSFSNNRYRPNFTTCERKEENIHRTTWPLVLHCQSETHLKQDETLSDNTNYDANLGCLHSPRLPCSSMISDVGHNELRSRINCDFKCEAPQMITPHASQNKQRLWILQVKAGQKLWFLMWDTAIYFLNDPHPSPSPACRPPPSPSPYPYPRPAQPVSVPSPKKKWFHSKPEKQFEG